MASFGSTGLSLTTRETVLTLTPATAATSLMVGRRPFGSPRVAPVGPGPSGDTVTAVTVPDAWLASRVVGRDLAGAAGDERGWDDDGVGLGCRALQAVEQELTGVAAERVRVLRDDGDARIQQRAEDEVVEADDGDLALAAELAQGERRADRNQVLRGEQCRRCARSGQQLERRLAGALAVGESE